VPACTLGGELGPSWSSQPYGVMNPILTTIIALAVSPALAEPLLLAKPPGPGGEPS
jgi:hypothetical protein